jgi:hypothetical protein
VLFALPTLYGAYRCQEKTRHVLSHFVTSLDCIAARLLSCSAALSGQSPEAACGAPKARGLTANARAESQYRCRDVQMSCGRYSWISILSFLLSSTCVVSQPEDQVRHDPRGARHRARKSRHNLVFGRSARIGAMMQSCASAAKLRGGGSILHSGLEAMVFTSDHRHLGFIGKPLAWGRQVGCPVVLPFRLLSLIMPDVRRCHPTLRRSWRDARAR